MILTIKFDAIIIKVTYNWQWSGRLRVYIYRYINVACGKRNRTTIVKCSLNSKLFLSPILSSLLVQEIECCKQ